MEGAQAPFFMDRDWFDYVDFEVSRMDSWMCLPTTIHE